MSSIKINCRGEKREVKKKQMDSEENQGLQNLMLQYSVSTQLLSECPIKSKIGKMFVNEKIFEEYYVKIYEIDPYFYKNYEEKIKVDNNGHEYIPFRIDVYFSEYNLVVEVEGKEHTDRDLVYEKKRKEVLEKKLACNFVRTNHSKENYYVFYEIAIVQTFISEFKNQKVKELEEEIK